MGASASVLEGASSEEIAEHVGSLGGAYEAYKGLIIDNAVNCDLLKEYGGDRESFLSDLGIENKLHRKKLKAEIDKALGDNDNVAVATTKDAVISADDHENKELNRLIASAANIAAVKKDRKIDELNHIFISYRQATDMSLASRIYSGVRATVADRDFGVAGVKPRIWWDQKSLKDGEEWEQAFVTGITNSILVVPIISWFEQDTGSVGGMMSIAEHDRVDNCLLEFELALAMMKTNPPLVKCIFPILAGEQDDRGFLSFPFGKLGNLPNKPSLKTKEKLVQVCHANGITLSEECIRRSVQDTMRELVSVQAVKLEDYGKTDIAIEECFNRVFDKAASTVLEIGMAAKSPPKKDEAPALDPQSESSAPPLPAAGKIQPTKKWHLIARQSTDIGKPNFWRKDIGVYGEEGSDNFCVLNRLEDYRSKDGKLEMRLSFPGSGFEDQHWKQTSNPILKQSRGVEGYEAIQCPYTNCGWGGLQYNGGGPCLLSGSSTGEALTKGWWWYAVGAFQNHGGDGLMPGPGSRTVSKTELYVKKDNDEWCLVFRQTMHKKYWTPGVLKFGEPTDDNFSQLDMLEDYRSKDDGKFELKLVWPDKPQQHWKQTSNPITKLSRGVDGYVGISAPFTNNSWGGLQFDQGNVCLLSGSSGEEKDKGWWWYAVGAYKCHEKDGFFPGPNGVVSRVELYAFY